MKKFELTISPRYVLKWGPWEALREIMQNVIDREYEHTDAHKFVKYWPEKKRLVIGNRITTLEKRTLLMGGTEKADNDFLIGQYGEGYKLAMLVLLRNGCRIRIRTGNEVWAPAIEYSKDFEADIIVVKIHKTKPSEDLTFEVTGLDSNVYREFTRNCLHLDNVQNQVKTDIADILMDAKHQGKIFVEGLFVCQLPAGQKVKYGYNMRPSHIELDRDRCTVRSFNLFWEIGLMYSRLDATHAPMIHAMETEKYADVEHYHTHARSQSSTLYQAMCNLSHDEFFAKHGKKAIPVKSEEEAQFVREKYNDLHPIVVSQKVFSYISGSAHYQTSSKSRVKREATPYSVCADFLKRHRKEMPKELQTAFKENLMGQARGWRFRSC